MRRLASRTARHTLALLAGASVLLCILGLSGACAVLTGVQANLQDHHYKISVAVADEHGSAIKDAEVTVFALAPVKTWWMAAPQLAPVETVERSGSVFHIDTHGRRLMVVLGRPGYWDQTLVVFPDENTARTEAPTTSQEGGFWYYCFPWTRSYIPVTRIQAQPFRVVLKPHVSNPLMQWESQGHTETNGTIQIPLPAIRPDPTWQPSVWVHPSARDRSQWDLSGISAIAAPPSVNAIEEMSYAPVTAGDFDKPLPLRKDGMPTFFYTRLYGTYAARGSITVTPDGQSATLRLEWQPDGSRCLP